MKSIIFLKNNNNFKIFINIFHIKFKWKYKIEIFKNIFDILIKKAVIMINQSDLYWINVIFLIIIKSKISQTELF